MATITSKKLFIIDEKTSSLGLIVGFVAITMLFITFLATFSSMMLKELQYIHIDLMTKMIAVGITSVLVISSLLFAISHRQWLSGKKKESSFYLASSMALGIVFLFGQISYWQLLVKQGLSGLNNVLVGMVYLMAGAHAIHLIAGLVFLAWLWLQLNKGGELKEVRYRLIGWFWHYLSALWTVILLYLIITV
ncbi:MAG: hypothetical protein QF842_05595 [Candidatus Marinimicrobia bacterium]|nr:hypothetical protein [Candidatus Neomarinimicrobiota bacterium]